MQKLKSAYISVFFMMMMAIAGTAGVMLQRGGLSPAWLGVLMTSAPILLVIGWLMAFTPTARTSAHFPVLNLIAALGFAITAYEWSQGAAPRLAAILALAGWVGFVLYARWYSHFGRKPSQLLQVGGALPRFTVKAVDGETVDSASWQGRPSVLVFFRGNWCPLCMAQVKELAARYRELQELGVRVALIAPQPHANTAALAKRFDVSLEFYTDTGAAAATTLGIDNPDGLPLGMQMLGYESLTVLPTVVITSRDGRIVWVDQTDNYRVRPEPDIFLEILRKTNVVPARV